MKINDCYDTSRFDNNNTTRTLQENERARKRRNKRAFNRNEHTTDTILLLFHPFFRFNFSAHISLLLFPFFRRGRIFLFFSTVEYFFRRFFIQFNRGRVQRVFTSISNTRSVRNECTSSVWKIKPLHRPQF